MSKGKRETSGPLDRSPSHLLHRALQRALDIYAETAGPTAVTQRQFAVLAAVAAHEGLTQADLVRSTGIDRSTLAELSLGDGGRPCGFGVDVQRSLKRAVQKMTGGPIERSGGFPLALGHGRLFSMTSAEGGFGSAFASIDQNAWLDDGTSRRASPVSLPARRIARLDVGFTTGRP